MRDAFVAALSLMVFHKHADRVKMANIAQLANVLQAMVLTKEDKMVLTPTYHVFEMFKVHQGASFLPLDVKAPDIVTPDKCVIQAVYATATVNQQGVTHISLANICLDKSCEVTINLKGTRVKDPSGRILTSQQITDYNDFDHPLTVMPVTYSGMKYGKDILTLNIPARSIVTLELLPAGK
ncbi:MAG: Intracellular exo-alpha-L-arabinofuranosidase 2 [Bacteroidetes bacterium ADurb.Bin139]|nr:MAG: Intracellular exo-alpha-L-arabinofuranosidase 2 [Bacteroidetes bacterium ADurb.Bin139]